MTRGAPPPYAGEVGLVSYRTDAPPPYAGEVGLASYRTDVGSGREVDRLDLGSGGGPSSHGTAYDGADAWGSSGWGWGWSLIGLGTGGKKERAGAVARSDQREREGD